MSTDRIHQRLTLQATERLQLRKQIETLFQQGEAFSFYPIRVIFLVCPRPDGDPSPVKVGFSIPKKRIRKAVTRNRYRRLLREAWRLHKTTLYRHVPPHLQLHCFLIFQGKEKLTFAICRQAVVEIHRKLSRSAGILPARKPTL